jgi:membrane protein implicated in regulation of membrane protease activity
VPSPRGWRGFATKPLGQIVLIVVGVLALGSTAIFLGGFIAILVLLIFGLALPIYLGLKVPARLAILGVVILLLAAPVAAVLFAQETSEPPGAASSYGENNGNVLQNGFATPYLGSGGQTYTFEVTVYPAYTYPNTTLENLTLFISTCPDATIANQSGLGCATPFPSYLQTINLTGTNLTPSRTFTYNQSLPGQNIYWWVIWATFIYTSNHTECDTNCIFLNPNSGYPDIEGPVTASYAGLLAIIIVPIYLDVLVYPGIGFFAALLFYTWFKARERRRKAEAAGMVGPSGPTPPGTGGPSSGAPPSTGASASEMRCPKCNAVVYATEAQCWKCGTPLTGAPLSSAPLPSGPSPPSAP